MRERVEQYILRHELISPGDKVLIGLSGGGDSVALLHILKSLCTRLDFTICAAHLNHGIRGEAAHEDAEFVHDLCDFYGIRAYGGYADIPRLARQRGETLEQAGRMLRYDFLEEAKAFFGADKIAVAHHMDDQAESILLHLVRGSGLRGLCGMAPRRGDIIRPLLCLSKAEIESYLTNENLPYCTDATNFIAEGTRNKLRLETIPYLKREFNPRLVESLCAMGEMLSEDEGYLCQIAERELNAARREGGFDRAALSRLPRPILSRCIRAALNEIGALTDAERGHIDSIIRLLSARTGARIEIPGADVWTSYELICFGHYIKQTGEWEQPLCLNGETDTEAGTYRVAKCAVTDRPRDRYSACIDADKLPADTLIRQRRAGDRFHRINAPGSKKLKDAYIDAKLPREKRDLALIASGRDVLFAPGLGAAESIKLNVNSKNAVKIEFIQK